MEYLCCLRLVPRVVDNLLVLWHFEHGLKVNRLVDGTGQRYELCHTLRDELISVFVFFVKESNISVRVI